MSDLAHPRFPRASTYDPHWMLASCMGPNVLWLTEWLCEDLALEPGMRVLDLGCGRAASSIFLAREFGVSVVAADLWITPTENFVRVRDAGCLDQVTPLRAEAHALPFAERYFDAIVSLDAYHYFGCDDAYIAEIVTFLRPHGALGIVVPGVRDEKDRTVVDKHFGSDAPSFRSPSWWRSHWERTHLVDVETADWLEDGWRDWLRWDELTLAHGTAPLPDEAARSIAVLREDAGRTLGFSRVIARRR